MDFVTAVQVTIDGLLLGGVYAVVAVGLSLVFGVMRVVNLAHGDLMVLGGLAVAGLFTVTGINPLVILVFVLPATFAVGMLLHGGLVERVIRGPELAPAVLLYGVSVILSNSMLAVAGPEYRNIRYFNGSLLLGPFAFSKPRVIAFLACVVLSAVTILLLQRTRFGRFLRATAQAPALADAIGIDGRRVRQYAMGLAAGLAAAGGTLLMLSYPISPNSGPTFLLRAFAVVVIGGLGSVGGAFVGALVLALTQSFATYFVGAQSAEITIYLLFILVLLLRPRGLFGEKEVNV